MFIRSRAGPVAAAAIRLRRRLYIAVASKHSVIGIDAGQVVSFVHWHYLIIIIVLLVHYSSLSQDS